jgi:hypothetical protein
MAKSIARRAIVGRHEETTMPKHAESTFKVEAWDEQPWDTPDGQPKMTRAEVTKSFTGDLEGSSKLQYLMTYRDDGSADFVAMERIRGTLGGKHGSFVLSHVGAFVDGAASGTWTIVQGSGTEELEEISGASAFSIPKGEEAFPFALDYDFAEVARVR